MSQPGNQTNCQINSRRRLEFVGENALILHRKLARLKFEKDFGPRHFTDGQRDQLIKYWHKYAGRTVKFGIDWEPEAEAFGTELIVILRKAGLTVEQTEIRSKGSGVMVLGSWDDMVMLDDFANSLCRNGSSYVSSMWTASVLNMCTTRLFQDADTE